MIYDEEVPDPVPGLRLSRTGVKLTPETLVEGADNGTPNEDYAVSLVVDVKTVRTDAPAGLLVMEVAARDVRLAMQVSSHDHRFAPGQRLSIAGRAYVIGDYEYSAFGLPDVRRDWIVEEVHSDG
jgi:hypothetical protein